MIFNLSMFRPNEKQQRTKVLLLLPDTMAELVDNLSALTDVSQAKIIYDLLDKHQQDFANKCRKVELYEKAKKA